MWRFRTWSVAAISLLGIALAVTAFGQSNAELSKADPFLRREAAKLLGQPAGKPSAAAGRLEAPAALARPLSGEGLNIPPAPKYVFPSLVSTQNRRGLTYLDTFITLAPGASTERLESLGVIIGSRSGDTVTADILPKSLAAVNALPEVIRITGSGYGSPMNDVATQESGVQEVWNTLGYQGANVMVGVEDSGVDWTHEDFKNPDGTTRFFAIWDHTDNGGPHPAGYDYGSLWTRADINAGIAREQDNNEGSGGHGTHVTGTAAGDGSATGNAQPAGRFKGVAHQAELLFVKTDWSEQSWADGCAWMYQTAEQQGKPLAINLSLGDISGPHDGSTAVEQFLSDLLGGPGRAMCIAAGNSGGQTIHAYSTLGASSGDYDDINNTPVLAFWAYPSEGIGYGFSAIQLWYPAGSSIQWRPVWSEAGGLNVGDWMGATGETKQYTIPSGELAGVKVEAAAELPYNDGRNLLNYGHVAVESPEGGPALNGWVFYVQLVGQGVPVHAWHTMRDQGAFVPAQVFYNSDSTPPAKLIEPDDQYTVAYPGSADKPICVASYVTKVQWTDVTGQIQTQQGATLGEISGFSSRGPRRDGSASTEQRKPDISAPGEAVISTLSSVLTQVPTMNIERDGVHQKMQGTSMSSPVVTGLAALMLSKNPNLTNEEIKQILRSTARDAGAAGWDPIFGAGRINAVAALNAVPDAGIPGDVNADGLVNAADAILISRHLAGLQILTGSALRAADANSDSSVNPSDVDWILEKAVGLR